MVVWKHLKPLHPWVNQVLSGIAFCHTHGVVHRDLRLGEQQRTVGKNVLLWHRLVFATVDGSEMRRSPPGMYKTQESWAKLPTSTGAGFQPSTVLGLVVACVREVMIPVYPLRRPAISGGTNRYLFPLFTSLLINLWWHTSQVVLDWTAINSIHTVDVPGVCVCVCVRVGVCVCVCGNGPVLWLVAQDGAGIATINSWQIQLLP